MVFPGWSGHGVERVVEGPGTGQTVPGTMSHHTLVELSMHGKNLI